jgi:transcriptional regulator with XRE-family HTH domain
MQLGRRIREIRLQKRLSQGEIERVSGMLRHYISQVENGDTMPSLETLQRFASVLDVPLHALFVERQDAPIGDGATSSPPTYPDTLPASKGESAFAEIQSLARALTKSDRDFILKLARRLAANSKRPAAEPSGLPAGDALRRGGPLRPRARRT